MLRLLDFKRFRVNTPEKVTGTSFADRLVTDMADIKGKIGTAALNIRATNTKDLVVAIANVMNDTIVSAFEVQNNAISALASQVTNRDMKLWLSVMEDKYSKHGGPELWVDPRIPVVDKMFKNALYRDE